VEGIGKPSALVVAPDPLLAERWRTWLERAGLFATRCPWGPASPGCPRSVGDPCPLRQAVDVAVVDAEALGTLKWTQPWAGAGCTKVPDDGSTVVVFPRAPRRPAVAGSVPLNHPVDAPALLAAVAEALRWARRPASAKAGQANAGNAAHWSSPSASSALGDRPPPGASGPLGSLGSALGPDWSASRDPGRSTHPSPASEGLRARS
jgi:hypothetical protein